MSTRTFPQVLQLNHAGIPVGFIKYTDAVCAYAKGHVLWELGDEDFSVFGGTNRISGLQSQILVRPIIAIRSVGKADGSSRVRKTPTLTNKNLFARDLNICAYCGGEYLVHTLTCDHIIPVSKGGKNTWLNCITACRTCNNIKDARTPEQADMPLLYQPYVPTHHESLILSNKHILPSQLEFLLAGVSPHSRVLTKR